MKNESKEWKNELIVWNRNEDSTYPEWQSHRIASFFGYELSIRKIKERTYNSDCYLGEIFREESEKYNDKNWIGSISLPLKEKVCGPWRYYGKLHTSNRAINKRKRLVALKFQKMSDAKDYLEIRVKEF